MSGDYDAVPGDPTIPALTDLYLLNASIPKFPAEHPHAILNLRVEFRKYMGDGTKRRWQCPEGCGLSITYYTYIYTLCVYFNDPERVEDENCWIAPYWHDQEGTYWPDDN